MRERRVLVEDSEYIESTFCVQHRRRRHTIHEVRQIDLILRFLGIMIGQDTIVDKLPSKSVRDDDDDTGDGVRASSRLSNVDIQSMELSHLTLGSAIMHMATEAIGTRHDDWRRWWLK